MPRDAARSSLWNDLRILWHLLVRRGGGRTHADRLESFYAGQAAGYDDFRRRMLHGREELIQAIPFPEEGVWVDLGAGTGENAEHLGSRLAQLHRVYLVDLSPSLLNVARARVERHGWTNVLTVQADATAFTPPEPVDVVTLSYSLTMIPDWFRVVDHALQLLRPGGLVGVVDFYVSRKYPQADMIRHGWWTRTLWPIWFAGDNVHLSPDHLPYIQHRLETVRREERRGKIPYLPLVRAPYYLFLGRKSAPGDAADEFPASGRAESPRSDPEGL